MRRPSFVVYASMLVAAACSADASAPGMSVRDSAGVRIVEYAAAPTPAESLSLSPEPLYRHGHRPGDHLFAGIVMGALLPNGGAVVVDGSNPMIGQELLLLGPDGALAATLARKGEGPSEVSQATSVTWVGGDTVLVEDDPNVKFMFFADTSFVRAVSYREQPHLRTLRVEGVDDAGRPLMVQSGFRAGFSEPWLQGGLVTLDLGTLRSDTVARYDMASFRPEGPASPYLPFGRATVSGGEFVVARSDLPLLIWRSGDGAVRQLLRWAPEPRYPTAAEADRFFEGMEAEARRLNPDEPDDLIQRMVLQQRARTEIPLDQPYPLFRSILGTDQGGVWLADFELIANPLSPVARYTVVDGDGTWLGPVQMPVGFRVLDVVGDRVLGVLTDELGVESVAVFELRREPVER